MNKIIINGFFAKGNCGDEAILHTWYERLSNEYRIIASIDSDIFMKPETFNKNKIYNSIELIQNRRVDIFCEDDIIAYIIGGGGLGLGFGIEQWTHAAARNKKLFYLGVIVHDEFLIGGDCIQQTNKNFFKSFNYIMVRDNISKKNIEEKFGVPVDFYPDVAFALSPEKVLFDLPKKFVTLTIRSNSNNDIESIKKWVIKIQKFAKDNNFEVIYLPFDKSDKLFMESIGIEITEDYQEIHWHPKEVKYIISKAEMVFSMGRFHPIVFSLSTGVTSYYIQTQDCHYIQDKSFNLLNDWGLKNQYLLNKNLNCQFIKNKKFSTVSIETTKQINKFFDILNKKMKS